MILVIVGILLIPPTILVIWYASARASKASAIRKLEHEVRQRGEPLTLAELKAKYSVIPDEENSAVALMALWEAEVPLFWQAFANGERPLPERVTERYDPALPYLGSDARRVPRVGPLDSNSLAAAASFLSAKASHLEAVHAAIWRPQFRFPINIEDGPNALLPHLSLLKGEALSFRIAALVASERGNTEAAILAVRDAARIGQILANEPILISQLVRVACVGIAVDGVEQLLSRQSLTAQQLKELRLFLEELNLHGVARSSLVNERPFSLCMFDPDVVARAAASNQSSDEEDSPVQTAYEVRTGYGFMQTIGYWDFDRLLMLETFRDCIALAGQETPESLGKLDKLFDEASAKARRFPPKFFSAMLLPALQKIPERFATFEARRRSALVAIGVERFRLEHEGKIPERLDALIPDHLPAPSLDPFDGQPLRFGGLGRGFVVYSIGKDREDNGGKEHIRGSLIHTDITFTVER